MPSSKKPSSRPADASRASGVESGAAPLTRERILVAALAAIDRDGLDAFNLRGLATALGVYPTAIYWHVPNREELIAGALEIALRDVTATPLRGDWRARLKALFVRFRRCLQRHPNMAARVAGQLGSGSDAELAIAELVAGALEDAGFGGAALVDAFNAAVAAMCGFATLELARPAAGDAAVQRDACRTRIAALTEDDHPALARHRAALANRAYLLRWTSGSEAPLDRGFAAWTQVVIDGLDARPRGRGRPAARGGNRQKAATGHR